MSSSLSYNHLRVPQGFGAILECLAREVLRDQPEDILAFAARYLSALLEAREESGEDPAAWAARLEDRFNNKYTFKGSLNEDATAIKTQLDRKKLKASDPVEAEEPEETQLTETSRVSPVRPEQEQGAQESTAQGQGEAKAAALVTAAHGAETATLPTAAHTAETAALPTAAHTAETAALPTAVNGAEAAAVSSAGDLVKAAATPDAVDVAQAEGLGRGGGVTEGQKSICAEELGGGDSAEETTAEGGESEEEAAGGGCEGERVEERASTHTDADICRSELDTSTEASISGLANVDVCAEELGGLQTDHKPISLGSIDEYRSMETSGSQLEEKEVLKSQEPLETAAGLNSKAEYPEQKRTQLLGSHLTGDGDRPESEVTAEGYGSEVTFVEQTCVEGQHEEPEADSSGVTQTEEVSTEAAVRGGGGDGERASDGEGGERASDGEGGRYGVGSGTEGEAGSEDEEPGYTEGTREGGMGSRSRSGSDSDSDAGTDKPAEDGGERRSVQKHVGNVSTTEAGDSHGGEDAGDGEEEMADVSKPEDEDDDEDGSDDDHGGKDRDGDEETGDKSKRKDGDEEDDDEDDDDDDGETDTGKEAQTSTLQDVSEIESTLPERSDDDECDVPQVTAHLGEHTLIPYQMEESSATHISSEIRGHEEVSGVADERPVSRQQKSPLEGQQGSQEEPEEEEKEEEEEEENPDASHPDQQAKQEEEEEEKKKGRESDEDATKEAQEEVQEPKEEQSVHRGGSISESDGDTDEEAQEETQGSQEERMGDSENISDQPAKESKTTAPETDQLDQNTTGPESEPDQSPGDSQEEEAEEVMSAKEECDQPQDEEDIMDIPLDDPEANRAAAKIQAGFRGHMTRKKMKDDKPEEVSSSGEALNGNQGNAGASEAEGTEAEDTSVPEQ